MAELFSWYREKEGRLISSLYSRYWQPRRVDDGSSSRRVDLNIKIYFRVIVLAIIPTILTYLEVFNQYGPYKNVTLLSIPCCWIAIYIYCKTDSERSVGYFAFFVLYQTTYWSSINSPKAFELFAVQSSVIVMIGGITLGVEGVLVAFVLNHLMGFVLLCEERKYRPDSTDLPVLWSSFVARNLVEGVISVSGILRFTETFTRFEQADKHKTEFLCRMSHELRTPLSGIIGSIDILKFAPLTEEYSKLLNIAQTCSKNLLQIINDILDFSKIEAGKMRLAVETVKLREVANAATQVVAPLLSQKPGVQMKTIISTELPELFLGDKIKIKQVLVNFLSNAVKFTHHGSIVLKVKPTTIQNIVDQTNKRSASTKSWARAAKYVKITVKDTGVGVSSSDFEKIFSAFEQATYKQNAEVVGGTGLGLNICLLLAKLMEGAISVKSLGTDRGSAFSFWVPYQDSENSDALKEDLVPLLQSTSNIRNILLVEDNAVNQLVIKGQLVKLGCKVDVAANGQLAINVVQNSKTQYDLIFLDLEMPIKDGITTVMEMRSIGVKTRVVALTAHAVEEKRTMALKAGMDDFLMKPCSIDTLKQCLDKYAPK